MLEKDHGHIVSIASMAGIGGTNGLCDYCASKFGAVGFQESLHMELKAMQKNIHTTVICPYFINTGMFDGAQTRCSNKLIVRICMYFLFIRKFEFIKCFQMFNIKRRKSSRGLTVMHSTETNMVLGSRPTADYW